MKLYFYYLFTFILIVSCKTIQPIVNKQVPHINNKNNKVLIDLVGVENDQVSVSFFPSKITKDTTVFYMPRIIPGTYSSDNYGQFITNLTAFTPTGEELTVKQLDTNSWKISDATKLNKITYLVNDTFDDEKNHSVFSPAGTNIAKNINFILNLHGFIGYFKETKEIPFELSVIRPKTMSSATSHDKVLGINPKLIKNENDLIDTFYYNRYAEVTDDPIIYGKLDSKTFKINDIEVLISVYSPNKIHTADALLPSMKKMMLAQKKFMGNINSTKKYSILVYLSTLMPNDARGFGALEHNNSTVVVLPERMPLEALESTMIDVVSHEFFHIITPLTVHSEEIHNFDYYEPKMSEHLWMYEGTTEYFAQLFQVKEKLVSTTEFFNRIVDKIRNANQYDNNMSFTKMSKNILEQPYKDNYNNVYEKGALISMCIDIIIRKNSNEKKGILDLMKSLSERYGAKRPFVDSKLIEVVTAFTYPEVGNFLKKHVVGNLPINYADYFQFVGLEYGAKTINTDYFQHNEIPYLSPNQDKNEIYFNTSGTYNSFLTSLNIQPKDVLVAINDQKFDLNNAAYIFELTKEWKIGDTVKITVKRNGEEITSETKIAEQPVSFEKKLIEIPEENLTPLQLTTKKAWLH
ncbi:peptidase M61 [Aquimarina agarivorans]|uniref:M61 family metallopeptidase n=1 Tax=Aquimarina agarivorans TaxID=980584 RepID=UPI000248FB13|nr:peptidase M61 [Aquimarina agarivorans]